MNIERIMQLCKDKITSVNKMRYTQQRKKEKKSQSISTLDKEKTTK